MSFQKVFLLGHLGSNVNFGHLPDGRPVANVNLATSETWRDRDNNKKKQSTEWHRLNFIDQMAEDASATLRKGSQVYVEGQLHTRKIFNRDGSQRYVTDVRVLRFHLIDGESAVHDEDGEDATPRGGQDTGGGNVGPEAMPW